VRNVPYSALHMKLPTRFGEIFWPVSVVLPDNSPREKATPKRNVVLRDDFLSMQKVLENHENIWSKSPILC